MSEKVNIDEKIAEAKAKAPVAPAPEVVPTIADARKRIEDIRDFLFKDDPKTHKPRFEGKTGVNPFLYAAQSINPLDERLKTFESGDEKDQGALNILIKEILKLKVETVPDEKALKADSLIPSDRRDQKNKKIIT